MSIWSINTYLEENTGLVIYSKLTVNRVFEFFFTYTIKFISDNHLLDLW